MHPMKKWLHLVALAAVLGIAQAGATNPSRRSVLCIRGICPALGVLALEQRECDQGITKDLKYKRIGIGGVACVSPDIAGPRTVLWKPGSITSCR